MDQNVYHLTWPLHSPALEWLLREIDLKHRLCDHERSEARVLGKWQITDREVIPENNENSENSIFSYIR